jgi:hypothetical protein
LGKIAVRPARAKPTTSRPPCPHTAKIFRILVVADIYMAVIAVLHEKPPFPEAVQGQRGFPKLPAPYSKYRSR